MADTFPHNHVGGESARHGWVNATVANGGTTSSAVLIRGYRRGAFYLPAEFNTDAITFEGAEKEDGTFAAVHNSAGAALGLTAASAAKWYQLPEALFGLGAIKIVTGTATGGAATIIVSLKS